MNAWRGAPASERQRRVDGMLVAVCLLAAYALVFVALSIDVMVRVWSGRFSFETPVDVVVLLYFEAVRTLLTLAGLAIAGIAAWRSWHRPVLGWFALSVGFITVAYTKAMAFDSFPGAMQQAWATALRAREVPEWLLMTTFGQPQWAVWLALPPLLLFAARYPRRLTAADVLSRADGERAGTLRSVALAGSDVRDAARRLTAGLLRGDGLRPGLLWSAALVVAALHTVALQSGSRSAALGANVAALTVLAGAGAVCITLLRTGARAAADGEGTPLLWLQRGSAGAVALVGIAAVAAAILPGGVVSTGAFSLAPAAMAGGLFMAAVTTPVPVVPVVPAVPRAANAVSPPARGPQSAPPPGPPAP